MVADSNNRWQGLKIKQWKVEIEAWYVNLWGSVYGDTVLFYYITVIDQSKTTESHTFNMSLKMTAKCQTTNYFTRKNGR